MNCQTTRDLLNVYIDDELDLLNHLEIEKHMQDCPSCQREFQNQQTLKSAFNDSMRFQAPPDFKKRLQSSLREANQETISDGGFWQWRWITTAAAAASLAVVIAVAGLMFFQSRSAANEDVLAQEMVSNHVRSLMANHLTDVPSTDQHTVKPWFDGKLDFSPPVIDLAKQNFSLIGGRLDYAGSRPIAALVYQRRQHFINLFIFPSTDSSDAGNKMFVRQGYNLIHWNKGSMTFWAVSDLNLQELQDFAQAIQN